MASKTMPVRLSSFAPAGGELTKMEDIADRDLRLIACEPTETQYGRGYRMTLVTDEDGGAAFEVLTSAVVVVKQLDAMMERDPFQETVVNFTKQGRCWIVV